jgi:hypothetical protein
VNCSGGIVRVRSVCLCKDDEVKLRRLRLQRPVLAISSCLVQSNISFDLFAQVTKYFCISHDRVPPGCILGLCFFPAAQVSQLLIQSLFAYRIASTAQPQATAHTFCSSHGHPTLFLRSSVPANLHLHLCQYLEAPTRQAHSDSYSNNHRSPFHSRIGIIIDCRRTTSAQDSSAQRGRLLDTLNHRNLSRQP